MQKPNRILVVSMCTRHCLSAVQWGISFARNYDAQLYIAHIMNNPFGLEGWNLPLASAKTIEDEYSKMLQDAKKTLQDYIKTEDTEGLSIEETVLQGNPFDEISKFVTEKEIDLLVMMAHEQGRIEHYLTGSEIRKLARTMPCSMFLVRRELEYRHY